MHWTRVTSPGGTPCPVVRHKNVAPPNVPEGSSRREKKNRTWIAKVKAGMSRHWWVESRYAFFGGGDAFVLREKGQSGRYVTQA